MHGLKVPDALARSRIETHHRFGEKIVPFARAAVVIVARSAEWKEEQSPRGVHAERSPDIGVANPRRGAVLPGLAAVFPGLGNWTPAPDRFAGTRIKCLHVAARIAPIGEPVGNTIAEDHQVVPDHRRRG